MAVKFWNGKEYAEGYKGATLDITPHYFYDDDRPYYVANVWDEESRTVKNYSVAYEDSKVDATPEILEKVAAYRAKAKAEFDKAAAEREAATPRKGKTLRVIHGTKKTPKGISGICFWAGKTRSPWSRIEEDRVGFKVGDQVMWASKYDVEVVV